MNALRAVYSYPFPEVWPHLVAVERALERDLLMTTTTHERATELLGPLFTPRLDVPRTSTGALDLDELHTPVLQRILAAYEPIAPGISAYPYVYPTPGTSEGIHKLLATLRTRKGIDTISTYRGEYEGYAAYAEDLGMRVRTIEDDARPHGWAFVSNPSARDGNLLRDGTVTNLLDTGYTVALDLAYAGMTERSPIDVRDPRIGAVFLSLSKPYGVFRYRIGCTLTREPIASLYGSKWFKDPVRLLQGLRIVEALPPGTLQERYRGVQRWAIDTLSAEAGIPIRPSDVVLLGHLTADDAMRMTGAQREALAPYARGDGYRFCLTPLFETHERITVP